MEAVKLLLFIMLHNVALNFESVDKIEKFDFTFKMAANEQNCATFLRASLKGLYCGINGFLLVFIIFVV